jgi:hypothetical protein
MLDLLRASDLVEVGAIHSTTSTRGSFVRSVYNALANGSDAVIVLSANTPDEITSLVRAAAVEANDDDADTVTTVLVDSESYSRGDRKGSPRDAADVLAAIHRHNANNPSAKEGKAYGAVRFVQDGGISSGGTLYGFTVEAQ